MKTHELKLEEPYFTAVWQMKKRFEIRKNDRNFAVGDQLILKQFDPKTQIFSGEKIYCTVLYILDDIQYLQPGYIALSINIDRLESLSLKFIK